MEVSAPEGVMLSTPTQAIDWLLLTPVLVPLITAAVLIMMRRLVSLHPFIAFLGLSGTVAGSGWLLWRVKLEGPIAMTMGNWYPPFGISFVADYLGAILAFAASVSLLLVALYAIGESNSRERRFGFYPLLMTLLVGVNGSFLTGDIFNLYVWFEVFLISSFGLIIMGGLPRQLDGAVKYCFLNLIATTLFLVATGYLYGIYGTLNMADLSRLIRPAEFEGSLVVLSALYLLAFSMKAAAFPLYFWLPASYHTPKIVVSALFAGLLTKVGVYALLRTFTVILSPALDSWLMVVLLYAGIGSMVIGGLGAVAQTDLRRQFSFLLVASVGFMMVGLSLASEKALAATIYYMVHSILVMTALFLTAGLVHKARGSLDLRVLSGVGKDLPFLSLMFLLLVFIASGFPPFSGFWPKLVLISESLKAASYWGMAAIIFSSFLSLVALARAFAFGFWRPLIAEAAPLVEQQKLQQTKFGKLQYLPLMLLLVITVLVGVMPSYLFELATAGAKLLLNPEPYVTTVIGSAK